MSSCTQRHIAAKTETEKHKAETNQLKRNVVFSQITVLNIHPLKVVSPSDIRWILHTALPPILYAVFKS